VIEKASASQYHLIEERLQAIIDLYGSFKATKICLVPDVIILKGFKMSQFNKFNGSQCFNIYLRLYYTKMIEKIHNNKLLMDCFHESLDEPTLSCYISINRTTSRS